MQDSVTSAYLDEADPTSCAASDASICDLIMRALLMRLLALWIRLRARRLHLSVLWVHLWVRETWVVVWFVAGLRLGVWCLLVSVVGMWLLRV